MKGTGATAGHTSPLGLALGAVCCLAPLATPGSAIAAEDPKEIVSATVRAHGHACEQPKRVERDDEASAPDKPVWVIECENGSYRVQYMGSGDPKVEALPR